MTNATLLQSLSEAGEGSRELDEFTLGYIEAAEHEAGVSFHRFTPDARRAVVSDCALAIDDNAVTKADRLAGQEFWHARQTGRLTATGRFHAFPPVAFKIGDEGNVRLFT